MTKAEFSKALLDMGFTATAYDSNNAWGFGGVRGELFEKGNIRVLIGKAGTRHRGEFPCLTITIDGYQIFDDDQTKTSIISAYKIVKDATTI